MLRFLVKRVLWIIPALLGVILVLFSLNYLFRDNPLGALQRAGYSGTDYTSAEHADDSLGEVFLREYACYVAGIFTRFDFGVDGSRMPVAETLRDRYRNTLLLSLLGTLLATAIGVPLGILTATRRGRALDYIATSTSLLGASVPSFWLALMLILVFVQRLGVLSAWGVFRWSDWILPVISIGLAPVANVVRMTRSSMLEVIRQDYVRTARSKGLTSRAVVLRHCVRNAVIPVVTVVGMQISSILGTSVIVETIFSINGLGTTIVAALNASDWPLMQGCIILISMTVCVLNLLVDLSYALIDPRIRAQYEN